MGMRPSGFPFRTAHVVGLLALAFLVGAAAMRSVERPAVSPAAAAAASALDARLGNAVVRLEESVAAARVDDAMLPAHLAALAADGRALSDAAAAARRDARGFRNKEVRAAMVSAADEARRAAVVVQTAADALSAYGSGALGVSQALSGVDLALRALADARLALAPAL